MGYSAGAIKKTCEKVLTKFRIDHQEQRPLNIQEFIGPLSLCSNQMDDEYLEMQKFGNKMTGTDKRIEAARADLSGEGGMHHQAKRKRKEKRKSDHF